jgi:hypothetical protein
MLNESFDDVVNALNESLITTARFLPSLLAAIVVFIIGVIVAAIVKNILVRILETIDLERILSRTGLPQAMKKGGSSMTITNLLGELIRWFVVLIFLIPTADILGLGTVNDILKTILLYIPNVVVAVVIVTIGVVIGHIAREVIAATVAGLGAQTSKTIGQIANWAIIVFASLAALTQLGVATDLIKILFTGFIAMIALAGGLAFGLGGRDTAASVLKRLQQDLEEKK